jgi:hypothetical protein
MDPFRYTLLGDGSSDRCLLPILSWVLSQIPLLAGRGVVPQFADLRGLDPAPRALSDRIREAFRQNPCEVLFVHRDAEGSPLEERIAEIREAAENAPIPAYVPVVPVRMTEAWLLIEEGAIRQAADNPNGRTVLGLPPLQRLERERDPKDLLGECLRLASEKTGRRLEQFERDLHRRIHRVAALIRDFTPLRQLPAFAHLESATSQVIQELLERPDPA